MFAAEKKPDPFRWTKMEKLRLLLLFSLTLLLGGSSCQKNSDTSESLDVRFTLPASIDVEDGGAVTLSVTDGKAPAKSDLVLLAASSGVSCACDIDSVSSERFSFALPKGLASGDYGFYLKRDDYKKGCWAASPSATA